jgi:hypothetical protein
MASFRTGILQYNAMTMKLAILVVYCALIALLIFIQEKSKNSKVQEHFFANLASKSRKIFPTRWMLFLWLLFSIAFVVTGLAIFYIPWIKPILMLFRVIAGIFLIILGLMVLRILDPGFLTYLKGEKYDFVLLGKAFVIILGWIGALFSFTVFDYPGSISMTMIFFIKLLLAGYLLMFVANSFVIFTKFFGLFKFGAGLLLIVLGFLSVIRVQ